MILSVRNQRLGPLLLDMQTSENDDAMLVAATRRGDHAALARIIERYQRPVYAVAFSGVRDRALADDLTQDTFVLAWKRLGELRDPARLPAWLCGIARNLARDTRKRQRRERAFGDPRGRGDGQAIGDRSATGAGTTGGNLATATPFEALDDAQCDQLVAVALADVPETYREPLILYYFEDKSIDDVARALGISAETTHRRLSRGRKFLAARTHELVETRVARRGPRPGIVVGVLAVVGGLAAGSHVEASPLKGLVMPKLVIATVLVATLGAAGILAADSARTPARKPVAASATSGTPATPVVNAPVVTAPAAGAKPTAAPSKTAPAANTAAAATSAPPAPALPQTSTIAVPDCAAVAKHMTTLTMATLAKKPFPAEKRALIEKDIIASTTRDCANDHWSETKRLCIADSDDYNRSRECTDEVGATPAELVGLPKELGCKALAAHAYGIANAPDGKFGIVRRKLAAQADKPEKQAQLKQIEVLIVRAEDQMAKDCADVPWTVDKRTCLAAATTQQALASCH